MRFDDLPKDWHQRPITDVDVFEGVIDLIATDQARAEGATYVLLCHRNLRLMQPVCLPDSQQPSQVASGASQGLAGSLGALFAELSRQDVRDVVMAIARPGSPEPTRHDVARRGTFERACRDAGVTLHGVAVATPAGTAALPAGAGAAAA